MSWIYENRRNWRIALFAFIMVAFIGPWGFDLINVPSQYECSAPNIRLEGDFCGVPLSGIRFYLWAGSGFISICVGLITGKSINFEMIRELVIVLLLLIPLLPIFSTSLLILFECVGCIPGLDRVKGQPKDYQCQCQYRAVQQGQTESEVCP
jgi:hypothetical protein